MGIRERLAKALNLPAGTTTMSEQQVASMVPQSGMLAEPLPRDERMGTVPFPPSMPLIPALINQPREDGRADPRRWEFPVAWNLQIVAQRQIPFSLLREVADGADIVRKCIETVKSAIGGMNWDISISEDAIARVMAEQNVGSTVAAKIVRENYQQEITRAKDFWRMPDRMNGLTFQEWVMMLLEEVLVIDALSIYPNKSLDNKTLHSLEILDGATIKPLLDERGGRPIPPHPAFQQILWGFPRGEFTASADADGEFTADDLIYVPRNRRTNTPYGYSPVERSLVLTDLYMKRIQWLRTEFTDGAVPDALMKTDIEFGNNPQLIAQYEQIMNDALSGNMEQRRRWRMLPNGFDPMFTPNSDAKYRTDLDDWLIKQICTHFGVLPTQIGMTAAGTLGETGHQEGEASTAQHIGIQPLISWTETLLNQLSHRFLAMPRDLSFVLSDGTESDEMAQAQRRQVEMFSGQKTWNEIRTEMGLPLYTFPEADAPLVVGQTPVPLSSSFESVSVEPETQDEDAPESSTPDEETVPEESTATPHEETAPEDEAKFAELTKFITWTKGKANRPFTFYEMDELEAEMLNGLAQIDLQLARDTAKEMRKKAGGVRPKVRTAREPFPRNHPARVKSEQLFRLYAKRLGSLGRVDTEALATAWLNSPHNQPAIWLRERNLSLLGAKEVAWLKDLYVESAFMGWASAQAVVDRKAKKIAKATTYGASYPKADWGNWKPGNPDVAQTLLGERGMAGGLAHLLDRAGVVIQGINETTLSRMSNALALASKNGWGVRETKQMLDVIVDDPYRAQMIASTELNRANTAAALDNYRENGATMVEWMTSDENACDECQSMADDSPYPIDGMAEEPPLHPWCGCQLIPADIEDELGPIEEDDAMPDETVADEIPTADETDITNTEEIIGQIETQLNESYSATLDAQDVQNLRTYQGVGYTDINRVARGLETTTYGSPMKPDYVQELRGKVDALAETISKTEPISEPFTTYRGFGLGDEATIWQGVGVGDVVTYDNFLSTSLSRDVANAYSGLSQTILQIENSVGTRGISFNSALGERTIHFSEHEWLLQRGTKLEVVSRTVRDGVTVIKAKVVKP